jgi:hypothetical protein
VRNEKYCAFEFFECFFKGFSRFIIEVIGWFIEDNEVILKFTEEGKKKPRSFSSGKFFYFS